MKLIRSLFGLGLGLPLAASAIGVFDHNAVQYDHQRPLAAIGTKRLDLTHDLIGLHKNLTEIESISGNELKVGKWLASSLKDQGYTVELQEVEKDRYNVLAWPGDTRNARLLITSHIDTVPPLIPYKAHTNKTDTIISGRGTVDAKGAVAAMIIAANSLLDSVEITPNDFAFLFVVGEEYGGVGMLAANSLDISPKRIIFGEPTEGKLASGHKGILLVELKVHGKAAHSGYPWLGRSANQILVKVLSALMDLEKTLPTSEHYGMTTFNIGKVQGGLASNVVAESATAQVAVRIASGTPDDIKKAVLKTVDSAIEEFKEGKEKIVDVDFRGTMYGPVHIDADVPGFDSMVVNYGTDIPNFNYTVEDQKRYLYGPGSILVAHSDHEALTLKELEGAVDDYRKLILHCLQT
ncbi:hypothetical protein ANO11243_014260 [Dothideomycetidae sp. 11243]|nr:hypothetical protein ANO11243_014260 [fungal sp. No.11243]